MDTFMDKLAQKMNAQEIIKANMAAETARMEQLQGQVEAYEALLKDMRHVNMKTVENTEQMKKVLQESLQKIEEVQSASNDNADIEQMLAELKREMKRELQEGLLKIEEMQSASNDETDVKQMLAELKQQMEETSQRSDDFIHKENVKVYRNVQAAMVEELGKQTELLMQKQQENTGGKKALIPLSVITILLVIADIVIHLFAGGIIWSFIPR